MRSRQLNGRSLAGSSSRLYAPTYPMTCYTLHNRTNINLSDSSMTTIMHQSFLTGKVNGIPYRGLLDVSLSDQAVLVSGLLSGTITIPIETVEVVKQIR